METESEKAAYVCAIGASAGGLRPLEEFFDAAVETGAEILLISSLNGEAEGWAREVKALRAEYKTLDNLILMIGGNLTVGTGNSDDIVPRYQKYGFDLVCHQVDLNTGLDMLEDYLAEHRPATSAAAGAPA